jgi:hypothetical protein
LGGKKTVFLSEFEGILIRIEPNRQNKFEFEIWFPFTRGSMRSIREGALVGIENFATDDTATHYSVLELATLLPIHYALGTESSGFTRAYPGFVQEAARSAATDWEQETPTEETTVIKCMAIPTNMEVIVPLAGGMSLDDSGEISLVPEENLPMVGKSVRLFDTEWSRKIFNWGIDPAVHKVFETGSLIRDQKVPVYGLIEKFVSTHFGVFGFTGSGKSNVLSTYISEMVKSSENINIVLFDLMSEYLGLLIDILHQKPGAYLISLHPRAFPESLVKVLAEEDDADLERATEDLKKSSLLPTYLEKLRDNYTKPLMKIIENNKIRLLTPETEYIRDVIQYIRESSQTTLGRDRDRYFDLFDSLRNRFGNQELTVRTGTELADAIETARTGTGGTQYGSLRAQTGRRQTRWHTETARNNLERAEQYVRRKVEYLQSRREFPDTAYMSVDEIVNKLNDSSQRSLFIIQSHEPRDLRDFTRQIGETIYESRRRSGQTRPLVSIIYDEADEFMRREDIDGSYIISRETAATLARRGRKFGVGIGIATQRIINLDTNILGQPHTYLVSKLPRQSDRQRIQEAFGLSEEMLSQTFRFTTGDWLLMSYDATGLKATPIPIHTLDANLRIERFLKSFDEQE